MTAARPTKRGHSHYAFSVFSRSFSVLVFCQPSHFQCVLQESKNMSFLLHVSLLCQSVSRTSWQSIERIRKRSVLLVFEWEACVATGALKAACALKSICSSNQTPSAEAEGRNVSFPNECAEKLVSRPQFCTRTRHYFHGSTADMTIMYLKSWK